MKNEFFHAIKIVWENCTGCTRCVRVCPTQALRVRNGKVQLDSRRCIDCGKCVTTCPYNALQTTADNLDSIKKFEYKMAIISTTYAGQFAENIDYPTAKRALFKLGFDEVASEAMVTEMMSRMIRDYIEEHNDTRPIISSHCPAIVRLIQVRFSSLLPNILHIEAPMSVLALYFKDKICREKNLKEDEVGIFMIVPCPAQVTAVHQPEGTYKNAQDGAISIREIYQQAMCKMKEASESYREIEIYPGGLSWAISGSQAEEIDDGKIRTLAVSGINNVIKILHKMENHQLDHYDYVVLHSCINGCVGGVLNVENPFIATSRIKRLLRTAKHKNFKDKYFYDMFLKGKFDVIPLEPRSIMHLDDTIKSAIQKMKQIQLISQKLPGLDCSACGSPSCEVLAEDIVDGKATIADCVVLLRGKQKK